MATCAAERPVAIVAALGEELAALRQRVRHRSCRRVEGLRLEEGLLDGRAVTLAVTGEGAANAERGLSSLVRRLRPGRLIALGVAGGLSPELAVGAVIVAREVRRDGASAIGCAGLPGPLQARLAVAVSASGWVGSPEEKLALRERLAPGEPAVVDLESWTYARVAQWAGIPWTVVRAVSDAHDEWLPAFLLACRTDAGVLRRSAVVAHALRHPGKFPELLRLRSRMKLCADGLSRCVEGLLQR